MKKWLVGLLAAGLCAASAWATDYTLVESTDDLAAGSYVITGNNATDGAEPAMLAQTPDKNYFYPSNVSVSDKVISDPDDTLVWEVAEASGGWTIHSGVGYVSYSGSGNTANAAEDVSDNSTWTISVAEGVATVANKGTADRKLQYNSGSPRFACYTSNQKPLKFYKAASGPVEFSVKLSPAEDFTVVQGKSASITATVKGAQGTVTYSWSVNGRPIDLAGNVYTVDSAEFGEYQVSVEVSDGVSDPLSASVKYTVVEAPVVTGDDYALVTSADDLQDGTLVVLTDPDGAYALPAAVASSVFDVAEVAPDGDVLTTDNAAIVWKLVDDGSGNFSLYNEAAAKYAGHNGADSNMGRLQDDPFPNTIALADAEAGLFSLTSIAADAKEAYRSLQYNFNNGKPRFAYYKGTQKNLRIYAAESGPAKPSVSLSASATEVEVGETVTITATAKNFSAEPEWSWTGKGTADGATFTVDTSAAAVIEVTATATAGEETASKSVTITVSEPAVKYAVNVDGDIANGSVSADKEQAEADELVTLTASPAAGFKLGTFLLDGEAIPGNSFNMPAHDVLVSAEFVEKPVVAGFTKITSLDELTEGEYVLVGSDTNGAYGAVAELTGSTKVLSAAAVTIEDDTVVDAEESQIWTLAKVADGWTIYNEALGFLGYSGSQNSAMAEAEASEKSTWTFSVAEGELFKVANVGTEGRTLRYNYNKGNMRFACYTSDTLPNIGLYKGESGPAKFSIKLDPAKDFEVEQGTEGVTVTATPKNAAEGNVTYEWMIDGTPVDATGDSLLLDTSVVGGPHKVTCVATDAAEARAEAHVAYTVTPPVVKYTITVDGSIANGSIAADKTEAEADELVTLTATPAGGYKLGTYLLDGEAISGNTFNMPAHDVLVSAEFVEKPVVAGFTKITSLDDLTEGEYVITGAKAEGEEYAMKAEVSTTSTAYLMRRDEAVTIEEDTVTDADEEIIWTLAQGENGWTIYNAAVGYAGYVKSGNSSGAEAEPSTKSSWTISESETAGLFMLNNVDKDGRYLLYNASSPRFACYTNVNSGKALAFYKGESGPAQFSVKLDPAKYFEVEVGAEAAITATPKNAEGDVKYAWSIGGTPVDATGAVLTLDTSKATEVLEVVCTATDGAGAEATASVSYKVVEPAAKYPITVERVPGGTLSVDKDEAEAGETVTVTATPDPGMKLESITFNGTPISGKTFTMPAEAVTVSGTFVERTGVVYTLVESADDFEAGAEYVVVAYSKDKFTSALKNEASGTRIGVEEVEITEENTVLVDSDAIVWQIKAGAAEGQYVLFNEAKGVYAAATKDDNVAQLLTDGTDALAQWTLKFDAEAMPKVGIWSVSYPERWLSRNSTAASAYFATYKGTQTAPYLFKRAGAPTPKITYTGATTVKLGGTFKLDFVLKNYSETYSWKVQGAGEITSAGAYSYTPSAVGTTVIKVQALDAGKNIIAQTEDITLTTEEADPDQPKVTCNLGTEVSGSAGQEFTFVFTAEKFTPVDAWVVSVDGEDVQENYDPGQSETFVWTPDADGTYTIVATTYSDSGEFTCTVTATIGGEPGPGGDGAVITKIEVDAAAGKVFLTTDGKTVKTKASLLDAGWADCPATAEGEGKVSVPLSGKVGFFKAEK